MAFNSKNMNYVFNVEYFDGIRLMNNDDASKAEVKKKNKSIREFCFQQASPVAEWKKIPGYQEIELYSTYPGVLLGIGNPHELAIDGAIKCGFSFDYVTGLPYLPGSSLKGILRSAFPSMLVNMTSEEKENHISYLKEVMGEPEVDLLKWESDVFENGDIFLGAYPEVENAEGEAMLEMEFITSHRKRFKNPNPVSIMKVKPNVKFVFSFVLNGTPEEVKQKKRVFRMLLLDFGVGAKTNVGFGRLSEEKTLLPNNLVPQNVTVQLQGQMTNSNEQNGSNADAPKCKKCKKNPVTWNRNKGEYNIFCPDCFNKKKQN